MSDQILGEIISPDLINLDGNFDNKIDAIESLLDLATESGNIKDKKQALDDLKQREEEATTGVGKGIGIPHAKTEAVTEPTVAFTRAENGVDFGAQDGEPARLLFMLLFPENSDDEYLDMLSSISRSLMHEEVRKKLLEAESKEKVLEIIENEVSE